MTTLAAAAASAPVSPAPPAAHAAAPAADTFASLLDALPQPAAKKEDATKDTESPEDSADSETRRNAAETRATLENVLSLAFASMRPASAQSASDGTAPRDSGAPAAPSEGDARKSTRGAIPAMSVGADSVAGAKVVAERTFHTAPFPGTPSRDGAASVAALPKLPAISSPQAIQTSPARPSPMNAASDHGETLTAEESSCDLPSPPTVRFSRLKTPTPRTHPQLPRSALARGPRLRR